MGNREDPFLSTKSLDKNIEIVRLLPTESFGHMKRMNRNYNRRNSFSRKQGWDNEALRSKLPTALVQSIVRSSLASKYAKFIPDIQRTTSWFTPLFLQEPAPTPVSPAKMGLLELLE